jgi:hypothetical protein
MPRWQKGEAEVEELIRRRELEYVTGTAADGAPLLVHARSALLHHTGVSNCHLKNLLHA